MRPSKGIRPSLPASPQLPPEEGGEEEEEGGGEEVVEEAAQKGRSARPSCREESR
jgi:hypothetical protein